MNVKEHIYWTYMTLAFQYDPLFLALGDIDLSLGVQKLLSTISFCLHLEFKLTLCEIWDLAVMDKAERTNLDFSVGRLEGLNFESGAIDSPILQMGDIRKSTRKRGQPTEMELPITVFNLLLSSLRSPMT